ncbi:hypothetical protein J2X46_001252 [Nocardioides sp. BE266]|nr:hypothetical protein [Nocardioides sp. BE266]MDR7252276.1 hypothetical protein [Nocardioides sp. BE266]
MATPSTRARGSDAEVSATAFDEAIGLVGAPPYLVPLRPRVAP